MTTLHFASEGTAQYPINPLFVINSILLHTMHTSLYRWAELAPLVVLALAPLAGCGEVRTGAGSCQRMGELGPTLGGQPQYDT